MEGARDQGEKDRAGPSREPGGPVGLAQTACTIVDAEYLDVLGLGRKASRRRRRRGAAGAPLPAGRPGAQNAGWRKLGLPCGLAWSLLGLYSETFMEPVVAIFPDRSTAQRGVRGLVTSGLPADRIDLLLPGQDALDMSSVPTDEAEEAGTGQAVGGVVGAAAGASAGFGLGAATASLVIPGVGPVTAIGIAAATLLGGIGAAGGIAIGGELEERTRKGVPKDEIYLYEDALAAGKAVLLATVESDDEASSARRVLEIAGAESVDAAREDWRIGIRET